MQLPLSFQTPREGFASEPCPLQAELSPAALSNTEAITPQAYSYLVQDYDWATAFRSLMPL